MNIYKAGDSGWSDLPFLCQLYFPLKNFFL